MAQDSSKRSADKQLFFEAGMKGDHMLVHLDARRDGVFVPDPIAGNPSLTLKFSYYFQGETTHDEQGINAYLRFGGQYAQCIVPWQSVWGMTDSSGKNRVWPEDLPREVMLQMARAKLSSVGKRLLGMKDSPASAGPGTSNDQNPAAVSRRADLAPIGTSCKPAPASAARSTESGSAASPSAASDSTASAGVAAARPDSDGGGTDGSACDPTPPKKPGLKRVK